MNDFYEEIELIMADIDNRVKHPYVMKFIDVPVIDEQKLLLLYVILKQTNLPFEKVKQTVVATMLVQIALDTHELVGTQRMEDDNPFMKKRQLTVLSGDYYSGLYYYLLAIVDDIPMIKVLSTAIKEINEHKITVYQSDIDDIDIFMDRIAMIDSLLVQKVAQFVGNDEMKNLAVQFLLVNKLTKEKSNFQKRGFSTIFTSIDRVQEKSKKLSKKAAPKQALTIVDNQIMKSIHYIELFLTRNAEKYSFLSEKLKQYISDLDIMMEKAVKEG